MLTRQTDDQGEPNNVNINKVLLDIIEKRDQRPIEDGDEDEDNQPSEEAAGPVRKKKSTTRQPEARSASKGTKGTKLDKKSESKGNVSTTVLRPTPKSH